MVYIIANDKVQEEKLSIMKCIDHVKICALARANIIMWSYIEVHELVKLDSTCHRDDPYQLLLHLVH